MHALTQVPDRVELMWFVLVWYCDLVPDLLQFGCASAVNTDITIVYVTTSAIGLSAAQQGPFAMVSAELHNG